MLIFLKKKITQEANMACKHVLLSLGMQRQLRKVLSTYNF